METEIIEILKEIQHVQMIHSTIIGMSFGMLIVLFIINLFKK